MLQTLQGLEDPRNKAVNPNPMPLPDIFYKVTRDNSCLRSFPTADELCVRETLESNYPQNDIVGFERNFEVEVVRKISVNFVFWRS